MLCTMKSIIQIRQKVRRNYTNQSTHSENNYANLKITQKLLVRNVMRNPELITKKQIQISPKKLRTLRTSHWHSGFAQADATPAVGARQPEYARLGQGAAPAGLSPAARRRRRARDWPRQA